MTWRHVSTSAVAGLSVRVEFNQEEGIYRAVLDEKITDFATSQPEARQRLAAKLEALIQGLRR
jgi:hypothetical protein